MNRYFLLPAIFQNLEPKHSFGIVTSHSIYSEIDRYPAFQVLPAYPQLAPKVGALSGEVCGAGPWAIRASTAGHARKRSCWRCVRGGAMKRRWRPSRSAIEGPPGRLYVQTTA